MRFTIKMFACVCHGVSHRRVEQTVRDGACTISDLGRRTGAGTGCGQCHHRLDALLDQLRARRATPKAEALAAK